MNRERFWANVTVPDPASCWVWHGKLTRGGYGAYSTILHGRHLVLAHKIVYVLTNGLPPAGHDVHHGCENKLCCNPGHLTTKEARTHRADHSSARARSRTHCPHGHEYTPENTLRGKKGERLCRECRHIEWTRRNRLVAGTEERRAYMRKYMREYRARKKAAA